PPRSAAMQGLCQCTAGGHDRQAGADQACDKDRLRRAGLSGSSRESGSAILGLTTMSTSRVPLSWSFDEAFRPAPAGARRERRPARRAWPATARVRLCRLARGLTEPGGRGRGALVALLFVYVTLAGFNCAH